MKKIKWLLSILIICLTFALVGCGKTLAVPEDLAVEDNVLSWTAVENATNYRISINEEERVTTKTSYSLSMLMPGNYVIKIKACDSKGNYSNSDWSEELNFIREYESGLVYTPINSNTEYAITNYGTARGDIVIEDTYKGKPVTKIAEKAFYGCGAVNSIVIGNNIKVIEEKAFQNCSYLASVTLPEGLTSMGEYAFQSCRALTEITLPSTLKTIPAYAFRYCNKLTEVNMNGVEEISASAFESCRALEKITISDTVTSIGASAFAQCVELSEVNLGGGVNSLSDHVFYLCTKLSSVSGGNALSDIGASAFENCTALTSFNFASTVNSIGQSAFSGCTNLSEITINDSLASIGRDAFSQTAVTEVENGIIYAGNWIIGCEQDITAVTFRADVVGIGDYAFSRSKIETLRIPDSVKYIGERAFYRCNSLRRLEIGNGVTEIGRYAFASCGFLGQGYVSLGTNVKTIQSYAFYDCTNLGSPNYMNQYGAITIPDTVEKIGTYAFKDTMFWTNTEEGQIVYVDDWAVGFIDGDSQYSVVIKEGTKGISDYAFYNSASLDSITIGDSVNIIGIAAFSKCALLSQVLLSNGSELSYLGDYMFYRCTRLQSIRLPVTIDKIGRSAFYKSGLMSIEISRWISEIGPYAFYGCESLLAVDFTNPGQSLLTKINDYTFSGCTNLVRINLPDSITEIGYKAFNKCGMLGAALVTDSGVVPSSFSLGNGLKTIGDYAFYKCESISTLNLPDSLETIGEKAFYKCRALTEISFGSGLKTIGGRAFYNCANIAKLNLPLSLETIGEYAFKGCNALTSVILTNNIQTVGMYAFYGCKFLTIYCETESIPENWNMRWNTTMRPVILGVELSADKSYVVSFTNTAESVANENAKNGFSNPEREGYTFVGWQAEIDGTVRTFTFEEFADIPKNVKLTAVWQQADV